VADGYDVDVEDVQYGGPADAPLLARIYRPRGARRTRTALVDVHGGAWSHFDRTADVYFDRALAASGHVVVALDFRQAPVQRYPTAVADIVAGIRFVKANSHGLDVDPAHVGLIGGSSGGHLLLLAAIRPNAPEYGTTPVVGADAASIDPRTAFALPLWPIADPLARYRYVLSRMAEPDPTPSRFFLPEVLKAGHDAFFGDEATMHAASVPRIVAAGEAERLPPIWIAHPELDENVTLAMSRHLADTWRGAGGSVELVVFPGARHSFANFGGAQADECIAQMRRFIARVTATPND
jgi:acetyl esterase/lipase